MAHIELGTIKESPGAIKLVSINDLVHAVVKHHNCDWGDAGSTIKDANDTALSNGGAVLSIHHASSGRRFQIRTNSARLLTEISLEGE